MDFEANLTPIILDKLQNKNPPFLGWRDLAQKAAKEVGNLVGGEVIAKGRESLIVRNATRSLVLQNLEKVRDFCIPTNLNL